MSLRLTKPGLPAAGMVHPKTGEPIQPLAYIRGRAVWPVLGASSDDPDDPEFTGEGESDEDDDDDSDENDDPKSRKTKPTKQKSSRRSEEDDDEEDEDEDEPKTRPERQAARYRTRLRAQERENAELRERLKAIEDKDRKPDEVASRDLTEARATVDKLTATNRTLTAQLAFFQNNSVAWADPSDAFALAEREGLFDDVLDEDGTVDARELRRGLRDLAKRKPHLVKKDDSTKARGRKSTEDENDEEQDDEEQSPRRSAPPMNSGRKGKRQAGPTREQLATKFPVLNRM